MASKFQWTGKKIAGLVVLVALIVASVLYGKDGLDAVGLAVQSFFNFGGMELVE